MLAHSECPRCGQTKTGAPEVCEACCGVDRGRAGGEQISLFTPAPAPMAGQLVMPAPASPASPERDQEAFQREGAQRLQCEAQLTVAKSTERDQEAPSAPAPVAERPNVKRGHLSSTLKIGDVWERRKRYGSGGPCVVRMVWRPDREVLMENSEGDRFTVSFAHLRRQWRKCV